MASSGRVWVIAGDGRSEMSDGNVAEGQRRVNEEVGGSEDSGRARFKKWEGAPRKCRNRRVRIQRPSGNSRTPSKENPHEPQNRRFHRPCHHSGGWFRVGASQHVGDLRLQRSSHAVRHAHEDGLEKPPYRAGRRYEEPAELRWKPGRSKGRRPASSGPATSTRVDIEAAIGKTVTAEASRARDGSRSGLLRVMTLPDGKARVGVSAELLRG